MSDGIATNGFGAMPGVCLAESLSTLKFANRAKNVRNAARVNEDVDQRTLLRKYERELRRLRAELQQRQRELVDKRHLLEVWHIQTHAHTYTCTYIQSSTHTHTGTTRLDLLMPTCYRTGRELSHKSHAAVRYLMLRTAQDRLLEADGICCACTRVVNRTIFDEGFAACA